MEGGTTVRPAPWQHALCGSQGVQVTFLGTSSGVTTRSDDASYRTKSLTINERHD